jgi:hypothetical protein
LKNEPDDFKTLSSERIITFGDVREIVAIPTNPANPINVLINGEMCRGCPAYCAGFTALCGLVEEAEKGAAVKSQYSRVKAVVDISRGELLRQEFLRLVLLLVDADSDGNFEDESMRKIVESKEFTIKVRGKSGH